MWRLALAGLNWLPRSSGSKGFGSGGPRNRSLRFLSKYQNSYLTERRNGLAICAADRFGGPAERLFVIYKEEVAAGLATLGVLAPIAFTSNP